MNHSLRINKRTTKNFLAFSIMMLPAFQLLGFDMQFMGSGTPSYIRILSLVAFVLSIGLYIISKSFKTKDIPVILYTGVVFFISIYFYSIKGNVSFSAMLAYISVFYATLYFVRKDSNRILDYFYYYFSFYWIIELIALITPLKKFFTSNTLTFIGHIQIYSMFWLMFLFICLMRLMENKERVSRLSTFILIILSTVITFLSGTSVSKIAVFVTLFCILFYKDKKNNTNTLLLIGFVVAIILNLSFVFMNYQNKFATLINFFGEDTSLNGRTYIWSVFMPAIIQSPIIGNGFKGLSVDLIQWGSNYSGLDYCHNTLLQEMANGGIIQTCLFIVLNCVTIESVKNIKNDRARITTFSIMLAMYLIMITESVTYFNYMNAIIVLVCNLDMIDLKETRWKVRLKR